MGSTIGDACKKCGASLTLHLYPRVGPAPGNMIVCTNDDCDASWAAQERHQQELSRCRPASPYRK